MSTKKVMTYSMLNLFRNCRKACQWRYVEELVPIERDDTLYLGSVFHQALESWYRLDLEGLPKDDAAINKILADIDSAFINRHSDPVEKHNWHLARAMFRGYISNWGQEPWQVVAVEQEFSSPIINPATGSKSRSFLLRGKVDLVVRMQDSDAFYLVEHKTASNITGSYLDRLPLDAQIQLYIRHIGNELHIPIRGVIYNVVAKARFNQRQGETQAEFEERRDQLITKSKTGRSTAKRQLPESDEEFQARLTEKYDDSSMYLHHHVCFLDHDLSLLERDLWHLTQQLLIAHRTNAWYRNTDYCFRYNRPCSYHPLCLYRESEVIKQNLYRHEPPHAELEADIDTQSSF